MKKITLILAIFLLGIVAVLAQESHDSEIEEGKKLVKSKTSCGKLSDEQLEAIGDYYMEQMHPGESHELMDTMMGGEGSASLKQVHITMAKRLYCNENIGMGSMMGGYGMMGNYYQNQLYQNSYFRYQIFLYTLLALVVIILILIILLLINKLKKRKGGNNKHGRQ